MDTSARQGVISIPLKKKVAFVCSGGATKAGAFHVGVALALRERGFHFLGGVGPAKKSSPEDISIFVGSSAGAIICSYLAAGYGLESIFNSFIGIPEEEGNTEKVLPRLTYQKMFRLAGHDISNHLHLLDRARKLVSHAIRGEWEELFPSKWINFKGLFKTDGIEEYMREEVLPSNAFEDYSSDLFIVATPLNSAKKVVFGKYSYQSPNQDLKCEYVSKVKISDAAAASTALPLFFAPHVLQNSRGEELEFVDGEIRDTLSTHVAIDAGADLIIASYTHQPLQLGKTEKFLSEFGLPAILIQSIYLLIEQKINAHIDHETAHQNAIEAVAQFCKTEGISERIERQISQILQKELHFRPDVNTIYIHPHPKDRDLFLGEHFTLSHHKLREIVRSGFRAANATLDNYTFANLPERKKETETTLEKVT